MTCFRKIWLIITKRSKHSIYLLLLVFLFSVLGIVGYYFRYIIESYHEIVIHDVGYSIGLYRTDSENIPDTLLEKIKQIDGVTEINIEEDCLITPLNFSNAVEDDTSDVFVPVQSGYIRLIGNLDTSRNIVFKNNMELISGVYPCEGFKGALIDSYLAEHNGFSIGDNLVLLGSNEKEVFVPIIGIYQSLSYPQESLLNEGGYSEYGQSPYSYVFCDLSTYEQVVGTNLSAACIIYTQNRRSLEKVYEELTVMKLPEESYGFSDRTEGPIKNGTTAFQSINAAADVLVTVSIVTTTVVLFFVIIVWLHICYKDIAVLISLGQHRCKVIFHIFLIVTIIVVTAEIIAIPICMFLISNCGDDLRQYVFTASGILTKFETDDYLNKAMAQSMGLSTYIKANFIYTIIAWVATCFASIEIALCNVRILFSAK